RGVCGSRIRHGQRVGAQLFVSRPEDIVVEEPAPKNPLLIPETPAGEDLVRMSGLPYVRRVRIRGEVTYRQPGVVWVENRSGATPVMVSEEPTLAPGDAVDAIGFPAQTSYGVGLQDAHLTRREASPPSQRPLHSAEQVIAGKMHGRLVRLRAQVIEQSAGAGAGTLLLGSGAARFTAKLSKGIGMALPRDTVVEITGVAMLVERPGDAVPSFSVLVRDLKVLHQAGAMALEQVILVVLSISVFAVAAVAWLTLLRRTVRRQTALIRARLEREAQLESDYRRLFERNPAGVFRWRPDGMIVDCNPAFAAMLGAGSRDALLGRSYWEFETDTDTRAILLNLKAGDAVASREVCLRTVAGGELWLIEHVCLVETPDGLLYEATAVDVTDRQRYREELRNAKDELERRVRERTADLESEIIRRERIEQELIASKQQAEGMSRAKSTFLANMSHELRTPLNAVIGYSEILAEDAQAAGKPEFLPDLERIRGAGKHLLALINDVLDLSKIEAGRMEVRKERFTVDAMVKDVLATVEPMARKTGNTLRADYAAAPLDIVADATKFRQSLLNLLSNACKFTDGGEVNLTVKTVPGEGQDWVEWAVCDTGIGISPENQARLFQAFSQVSNATSRKFSGTGLGLAISKRYCQLMGGDITFSSEPGQGSRFVIRLPASPPESSAHGQTETSAPAHPPD
ncbi:MAG: ATP-binding protein, partial [Bryobacteraceae bacterium]|nr:ATP-binding protein [Bryobacteraceae bacterium]